jgi:hypothetical protein
MHQRIRRVRRQVRVKNGGSGLVRRPSGLPSTADISLCCRKPRIRARADFRAPRELRHEVKRVRLMFPPMGIRLGSAAAA